MLVTGELSNVWLSAAATNVQLNLVRLAFAPHTLNLRDPRVLRCFP